MAEHISESTYFYLNIHSPLPVKLCIALAITWPILQASLPLEVRQNQTFFYWNFLGKASCAIIFAIMCQKVDDFVCRSRLLHLHPHDLNLELLWLSKNNPFALGIFSFLNEN
jgi:hypothetical protein